MKWKWSLLLFRLAIVKFVQFRHESFFQKKKEKQIYNDRWGIVEDRLISADVTDRQLRGK